MVLFSGWPPEPMLKAVRRGRHEVAGYLLRWSSLLALQLLKHAVAIAVEIDFVVVAQVAFCCAALLACRLSGKMAG